MSKRFPSFGDREQRLLLRVLYAFMGTEAKVKVVGNFKDDLRRIVNPTV